MVGVALDPLLDLLEVHGRLDALVVRLHLLLVDGLGKGPALLQALDLLFQEFVEHVSEGHLMTHDSVEYLQSCVSTLDLLYLGFVLSKNVNIYSFHWTKFMKKYLCVAVKVKIMID